MGNNHLRPACRAAWSTGLLTAVVVVLAGCGSPTAPPAAASAPITVQDCHGKDVTFAGIPQRVVTLDGYAAQTMARLGLTNRIVGTGYPAPFTVDNEPYRGELGRVPVLSQQVLVTEVVAAERPDLVLTGFAAFGGPPGSPKDTDLSTMRTHGLAACLADGEAVTDLAPTYDFLLKLGKVFQVEDRAAQVVADLRAREQAVTARTSGDRSRVLVLQDNPVAGQPLKTSGTATIAQVLIGKAGGQNIFTDVTSMHADVSAEEVLKRDPEVIWVISDYPFTKVKGPELVRQVADNPLLASTSAVKRGRVVATSQYLVSLPTPLNLDGLEQLTDALQAARR